MMKVLKTLYVYVYILICINISASDIKSRVLQYDVTLEYDSYCALTHYAVFARYWVSEEYYKIAIIWAEPNGRGQHISIYPPTLKIESNSKLMSISHEICKKENAIFQKPITNDSVFRFMYGDYPVQNLRFVDESMLRERLYIKDITNSVNEKISYQNACIKDITLYNTNRGVSKKLEYEYGFNNTSNVVIKMTAIVPQTVIKYGFEGDGVKVTITNGERFVQSVDIPFLKGGREYEVDYESLSNNTTKALTVLSNIRVKNAKTKELLRSAKIKNVKVCSMSKSDVDAAAQKYCELGSLYSSYRKNAGKYWLALPQNVEKDDKLAITNIARCLEDESRRLFSDGEYFRNRSALIELYRILGDDSKVIEYYTQCLQKYESLGMDEMTMYGGYGMIDVSILSSLPELSEKMYKIWIAYVRKIKEDKILSEFALRQEVKGEYVSSIGIIELIKSRNSGGISLDWDMVMTRAAYKLNNFFLRGNDLVDFFPKTQLLFAKTIYGENKVKEISRTSIAKAYEDMSLMKTLNERQLGYKKWIESVRK